MACGAPPAKDPPPSTAIVGATATPGDVLASPSPGPYRALTEAERRVARLASETAAQAVVEAKMVHGVSLRYGCEPLDPVGAILAKLHTMRDHGQLPDAELQRRVRLWAAFVGENMRYCYADSFWRTDPKASSAAYAIASSEHGPPFSVCALVERRITRAREQYALESEIFLLFHGQY
jgi:hypothetical protein